MDAFEKKIMEIIGRTARKVRPSTFVKENYGILRDWKLAGRTSAEIAQILSEHGVHVSCNNLVTYMDRARGKNVEPLKEYQRTQRAATAIVGKFLREHKKAGYSVSMLLTGFEDWKKRLGE
jgi:hypothetical protein